LVAIIGFEGQYSVTRDGRVWSHKREQWLSPVPIHSGYLRVQLRNGPRVNKKMLVHRLVANAFIPNPNNKPEVHHKDANRANNAVENLEWVTREENNQAAWDCGNKKFVKTERMVAAVRENIKKARLFRKNKNKGAACNTIST
jgi:hypothetical protein